MIRIYEKLRFAIYSFTAVQLRSFQNPIYIKRSEERNKSKRWVKNIDEIQPNNIGYFIRSFVYSTSGFEYQ